MIYMIEKWKTWLSFLLQNILKTKLLSDIFQGTHFCFLFCQSSPNSLICCEINIRAKKLLLTLDQHYFLVHLSKFFEWDTLVGLMYNCIELILFGKRILFIPVSFESCICEGAHIFCTHLWTRCLELGQEERSGDSDSPSFGHWEGGEGEAEFGFFSLCCFKAYIAAPGWNGWCM